MDLAEQIVGVCKSAKKASFDIAAIDEETKNNILLAIAGSIEVGADRIEAENAKDIEQGKAAGLSDALLDRLTLNHKRIKAMSEGLRVISGLKSSLGDILSEVSRPNGLLIRKVRVPIGVICIIYESRPNVTADAAGLCIKSGNAVILRGGKEAINSNKIIAEIIVDGIKSQGLNPDIVQLLRTADREAVNILLRQDSMIDMVIPRGGEGLIRAVAENSRIPVLKHYKGICHVFVDRDADQEKAAKICVNAKVQRPGVCNAMETMLVDAKIAEQFLPEVAKKFHDRGVEVRGCKKTQAILPDIKPATEKDWHEEYLDLILSVRVVGDVSAAINHINKYGSRHSDAVVTENKDTADKFLRAVDSAAVYVNASTRFTDGFEFGMGAEMGISTDKLHARGPVALEELTTYKYMIYGDGQVRE